MSWRGVERSACGVREFQYSSATLWSDGVGYMRNALAEMVTIDHQVNQVPVPMVCEGRSSVGLADDSVETVKIAEQCCQSRGLSRRFKSPLADWIGGGSDRK